MNSDSPRVPKLSLLCLVILVAVGQQQPCTWHAVRVWITDAGWTFGWNRFDNAMQSLVSKGLIVGRDERAAQFYRLTATGRKLSRRATQLCGTLASAIPSKEPST